MKYRQMMLSLMAFAIVVGGLVYVDPRVSSRFTQLASGEGGISSRVAEMGGMLLSTIRYQSLENAPLFIFAVVGAVLFLFMVRT
jgi:uncharacterized membrane protein YeaQ/YmgE (transglycosylase-associated protein family)